MNVRFKKLMSVYLISLGLLIYVGCSPKSEEKKATVNVDDKSLFSQTVSLDLKGNINDALDDINKVIGNDPNNAGAYGERGNIYVKRNEYDLAITDFNKSISLKNNYAEAYASLGLIYCNYKGDYQSCLDNVNKAIAINPKLKKIYTLRGYAYLMLNNYSKAIEDMRKSILYNDDVGENYNNRCYCFDKLGQYAKALTDCNNAIALSPDASYAYDTRSEVYLHQKNYDKAWDDVKRVIQLGGKPSQDVYDELKKESGRTE